MSADPGFSLWSSAICVLNTNALHLISSEGELLSLPLPLPVFTAHVIDEEPPKLLAHRKGHMGTPVDIYIMDLSQAWVNGGRMEWRLSFSLPAEMKRIIPLQGGAGLVVVIMADPCLIEIWHSGTGTCRSRLKQEFGWSSILSLNDSRFIALYYHDGYHKSASAIVIDAQTNTKQAEFGPLPAHTLLSMTYASNGIVTCNTTLGAERFWAETILECGTHVWSLLPGIPPTFLDPPPSLSSFVRTFAFGFRYEVCNKMYLEVWDLKGGEPITWLLFNVNEIGMVMQVTDDCCLLTEPDTSRLDVKFTIYRFDEMERRLVKVMQQSGLCVPKGYHGDRFSFAFADQTVVSAKFSPTTSNITTIAAWDIFYRRSELWRHELPSSSSWDATFEMIPTPRAAISQLTAHISLAIPSLTGLGPLAFLIAGYLHF